MRRTIAVLGMSALLVPPSQSIATRASAAATTADQLVGQVISTRTTTGFRARATLTVSTPGTTATRVRQLLIRGRRDRQRATTLYQQVWPLDAAAPAVVVADAGDHRLGGFQYQSGKVRQLTARMVADRLFDSDLRLEDLAESFWYWRSRSIVGDEHIGEYHCVVVELRPDAETATAYSRVKAWVSPDVGLALRLEQFGRDGKLTKTINAYRLLKLNGRRWPGILVVEPSDGRSRTVVEGAAYDADLNLRAADFTLAAVRKAVRPPE